MLGLQLRSDIEDGLLQLHTSWKPITYLDCTACGSRSNRAIQN